MAHPPDLIYIARRLSWQLRIGKGMTFDADELALLAAIGVNDVVQRKAADDLKARALRRHMKGVEIECPTRAAVEPSLHLLAHKMSKHLSRGKGLGLSPELLAVLGLVGGNDLVQQKAAAMQRAQAQQRMERHGMESSGAAGLRTVGDGPSQAWGLASRRAAKEGKLSGASGDGSAALDRARRALRMRPKETPTGAETRK